jgi:surface antigen
MSGCTVMPWVSIGAPVNPGPAPGALAHALGTDGTALQVAWVADMNPRDEVYVHEYSSGSWSQLGLELSPGNGNVQPQVDIQFNGGTPNVLYVQTEAAQNIMHVKSYSTGAWSQVGGPGYNPTCMMLFSSALALDGASPHAVTVGAGGCGIGVTYASWDGSAWWLTPTPPAPMPGLITMNGGSNADLVHDGSQALVAMMDGGHRYVRYWDGANTVWADLGGSLNMGAPGAGSMGAHYLSMALDASGTPYVAFAETVGTTIEIYVKQYDSTNGWTLVGTGKISGPGNADQPSIALIGGMPHVAFVEQVAGVGRVLVRRYNGTDWQRVGAPLNAGSATGATMPYLVGVGTTPMVAYREPETGAGQIVVKQAP